MTFQHAWRAAAAALVIGAATPVPSGAEITFGPAADRATGETYRVELGAGWWNPTQSIIVSSEALGIPGTPVDFVANLDVPRRRFPELRLVARPATKHKFRISYIPIEYTTSTSVKTEFVFNGQRFTVGVPVDASFLWRAWRFAYEYDAFYRSRGFLGFIVEAKHTDVEVSVASAPLGISEFVRARFPIPALGGIGRVYLLPNVAFTGEITGIAVPDIDEDYDGRYVDYDFYGTVNFSDHVGGQFGYRRIEVSYLVRPDAGELEVRGFYFMGVVRF